MLALNEHGFAEWIQVPDLYHHYCKYSGKSWLEKDPGLPERKLLTPKFHVHKYRHLLPEELFQKIF